MAGEAVDRSRLGRRSRNKGQSYERRIRDRLKEAFGVVLQRTPLSGGFRKGEGLARVTGDLNTLDPTIQFRLHVECKNATRWSVHKWWKQATDDCPKDKIPVLFMHQGQENKDGRRTRDAEDFVLLRLSDFLAIVDVDAVMGKKEDG